ncbi:uncharacterized protein LOC133638881 [Entelurus aequoreus]|uniref:uncharacterized protein LOC133638881 n=1 Tax=Entelurus aequoreus TaxID=161455 RepID=UPI002B1DDE3E|nr:uncharacterized protein LOC133638881 [Entelurus aequoreus]
MATPTKKKKKYVCKFQDGWKKEFQFIQDSSKGKGYAACTFCSSDFSIEHGGRTDVVAHERSEKHKSAATTQRSQPSIMGHLEGVTYAEAKMAMLIAASNVPASFAEVFNKSVKDMFPDSEIARQYANGTTEATQTVKGAIAPELDKEAMEVIDTGCVCHLVQLAAGCGIQALRQPIEDILSSIYAHFDISAKRCEISNEFVEFADSETLKTLRDCATRWLSLLTCINRVLSQWDALHAHFASHEDAEEPGQVNMLAEHLTSKKTKFFFLFLSQALKPLADFNVMFQAEGVLVGVVRAHQEMTRLVKRFMGRFLPSVLVADVPLKDIEFKDASLQLADGELFLGGAAQNLLEDNMDELSSSVPTMIKAVRDFFVAVTTKMMTAFPLDNIVLQNLTV